MNTTDSLEHKQCQYCGNYHSGICPRIEEIEYHQIGTIKRIKFTPSAIQQKEAQNEDTSNL